MSKYTGIVKWYSTEKEYGFISCNEGNDVFVHHSQVKEKGSEKERYPLIFKKVLSGQWI